MKEAASFLIGLVFWGVLFPDLIQGQNPIILPRIDQPIILDGVANEAVWQTINPLPLVTHTPEFGEEPYHPTIIRVAYDDHYLYLSAICDTPPKDLFLTSYRRNHMAPTNDYIAIVLDTFNDNENALVFSVMPTGARLDYTVSNDAQGSNAVNTSWNTFWDAETSLTENGWSAEIRIPFSSLRFQDRNGRVEMGMIVYRWFAVNTSVATFPPIQPNWGFWSFNKPSQAAKVVMEGVYNRKTAYLTPYILGGLEQSFLMNSTETAYSRDDQFTSDIGLDFKYGITNNLTLDLSFNTDFAQVEADDQQVNLTRFSIFFPEKRLFFQERASIFNFGTLERSSLFDFSTFTTNQLFYSRRIGLYEGRPVPLIGGLRMVGRLRGWDIGLLNMQSQRVRSFQDDGRPLSSENFGVLRLRRQVFNPYSYTGIMATSRYDTDGKYNIAFGLDGNFRVFPDDYLSFSLAQTAENDIEYLPGNMGNSHIHIRWENRSLDGLGYDMNFSRSGERYNPGTGFILRSDYTRVGDKVFYGWFPGEHSILQQHQIYMNGALYFRNSDGTIESSEWGPSWEATLKSGNRIAVKTFFFNEHLAETFSISNRVEVPAGSYRFSSAGVSYELFGGKTRGIVTATGGSFFDGSSVSMSISPTWILSKHLQLQGFYRYTHIRFQERDQVFNGHLARLKLDAAINKDISSAGFIQFNSSVSGLFVNLRIRYNPREGNDFYIVYNEGFNTDRYREAVPLPVTSSRTILLKYSYTMMY